MAYLVNPFTQLFGMNLMNRYGWVILLGIIYSADMEWKAEFRYRAESDKGGTAVDTLYDSGRNTFHFTRSRVSLRLSKGPVTGFAQFQDSRMLGDETNRSGSTKPSDTKVELHQVYFQVHDILKRNWSIRFGRFELPLGGERLFSKTNWNNVGRSFEGIHSFGLNRFGRLDLFSLFLAENSKIFPSDEYDHVINGIYFNRKRDIGLFRSLDLYYINERLADIESSKDKYRKMIGSRVQFSFLFFGVESEYAYQFGKLEDPNSDNLNDIQSRMAIFNAHMDLTMLPVIDMISFGQEYFSGYDSSQSKITGFANPWGAGHKYHGYYDTHTRFNDNFQDGLFEWNVKTALSLPNGFKLNIHYHNFKDGVDFEPYGTEMDVVISKKLSSGGVFQQGFSRYWQDGGSQLDYSWLMLTFTL